MSGQLGSKTVDLGSKYLTELRDSNDIFDDTELLRNRLEQDGYLLIRGFHERDLVLQARQEFLSKLKSMGRIASSADSVDDQVSSDNKPGFWGASASQLQSDFPTFLDVVNSTRVMGFFERLLGGPILTYDYKWPRAVSHLGSTGAHYDVVYMGRGTKKVYTMWTPFGDIPLEKGPLAVCLGSQNFEIVKKTYGQMDVDRDNVDTGWLSHDPFEIVDRFGGQWATTEFHAGDVIFFGMFTLHASLVNTTREYRISADTRYQLATEPVDDRWIGERPRGHYAWGKTPPKSVEEARREWGI